MATLAISIDLPPAGELETAGNGTSPTQAQMDEETRARHHFVDTVTSYLKSLPETSPHRAGNVTRVVLLGRNVFTQFNHYLLHVTVGIVQSCGIVTNGAGYCWGDNSFGQLGVPSARLFERCGSQQLPCSTVPVAVFGRQRFTEISTGFGSHVCGVTVRSGGRLVPVAFTVSARETGALAAPFLSVAVT